MNKEFDKFKETIVKNALIGTAAAAMLALAPFASAKAEISDLEVIFVKADQDGDFALDLGEVLVIGIAHFKQSDTDKNGKLDKEEAGEHAADPEFSDNDTNKDGGLSMDEVIAEKIADFKAADTDGDGALTIDEVKKHYDGK